MIKVKKMQFSKSCLLKKFAFFVTKDTFTEQILLKTRCNS